MNSFKNLKMWFVPALVALLTGLLPARLEAGQYPFRFTDAAGRMIEITARPERVVSLLPSASEMLLAIGAADALAGVTIHCNLPGCGGKPVVGGFGGPDLDRLAAVRPEIIFLNRRQYDRVAQRFQDKVTLVTLATTQLADAANQLRLLGRIFAREQAAAKVIAGQDGKRALIAAKVATLAAGERLRVMRIMGRDQLMAPGDDSFQNDLIRAAGGIPPRWGKNGGVVPVSLAEWQRFNPQAVYGCGDDRTLLALLRRPGWNQVAAVQQGRIFFFPCELTCRAATHTGDFVAWLASRLYQEQFGQARHQIHPDQLLDARPLALDLDYLKEARIVESRIQDFVHKTLLLSFDQPMRVLSTLEGERPGITVAGNHSMPPPSWGLGHGQGLAGLRRQVFKVLGFDPASASLLFTGADLDNLALSRQQYRELVVYVLATAGVRGNALRMGADQGSFYPDRPARARQKGPDHHDPGTINILLLTNVHLSPRAMARAVITITEAKSAALADLDIRSTASQLVHPATGTGTDNILVIEGRGIPFASSGGHTKLGELIARATRQAVTEAIEKQNGITSGRTIFQRLRERRLDLFSLCRRLDPTSGGRLYQRLERLLLTRRYAGFLATTLAATDAEQRGLLADTSSLEAWGGMIASEISGRDLAVRSLVDPTLPAPLRLGLNSLLTGLLAQPSQE